MLSLAAAARSLLRFRKLALGAGLLVAAGQSAPGGPMNGRGVWWWSGGASLLRVDTALGEPALEDRALATLLAGDIRWLYESSGSLARTQPARVAAWHRRLAANGIGVQLLLSDNTWVHPANRPALLALVQQRLLDFNAARSDSAECYRGLHLDIEPHALDEWAASDAAGKRALLIRLSDTLAAVRQQLEGNGGAGLTLQADLPVWFDNVGATEVWTAAADRDAWFAALGGALDAISLMAYERPTVARIQNGIAWELANFGGQTRCALEFAVGAGRTWPTLADTFAAAAVLEADNGPAVGCDLHSLNQLSELAPAPVLPPWLSRRAWRLHYFATEEVVGEAADLADPDGDGLPNLVEYALGADPRGATAVPVVTLVEGRPALVFTRMRPATDVVYAVEASGDLLEWTRIWTGAEHPLVDGGARSVVEVVPDAAAVAPAGRRFLRLRITAR